jgi:hypothetical protein
MFDHGQLIKRSSYDPQEVLALLRGHFPASSLEKYDSAIIKGLFNDGMKRYQHTQRVGKRLLKRVQDYMVREMQKRYGPYVNVLRKKDRFMCNFVMVYKTDHGRLYQSAVINDLFITAHALDRFSERIPNLDDFELTCDINPRFINQWGTKPTAYDTIETMISASTEYGVPVHQGDLLVLNLYFGFLVLEVFEHFSLGKTFLLPDMDIPKCEWFSKAQKIRSVDVTLLEDSEPIKEPITIMVKDGKLV